MRSVGHMTRTTCIVLMLVGAPMIVRAQEQKVALLVGVNQYDKPIFSKLNYAEHDVDDVGAELKRLGFAVTVLKGSGIDKERATRQNIVDTLGRLVEPLGAGDVMVVMLSGHGQQFEATRADGTKHDDAFYCPVDAVSNKPETLISLSYVIDDVLAPNVGRKLLLVDACRDAPKNPGRGSRGIQGRVIALPEDTAVLFSCRAGQQSWENDDLQHGLFTYCVLEALKGEGAKEQEVSWTDVVAYVNRRMAAREMRDRMPRPQDPIPAGGVPYTVLGQIGSGGVITNSIGMKLVLIPAGEFLMGSSPAEMDELARLDSSFKKEYADAEQPQHRVRITKPFYLGQYEVTKGEFAKFVTEMDYQTEAERDGEGGYGWNEAEGKFEGRKPQYTWRNTGFAQDDSHPVVNVSWNDAVAFCEWLTQKEGKQYRLPTEAEWEYACRAGTTTLWQHGNDPEGLARIANIADGTAKAKYNNLNTIAARDGYVFTAPVGRLQPNNWGLFDMHGNVLEWCADWYDAKAYEGRTGTTSDPIVRTAPGDRRVLRGGSWERTPRYARSANRFHSTPEHRYNNMGFRLLRTP